MNRYQHFTIIMNKILREIRRIKNEEMKEYGLKSVHVSCIYYLYNEEKLTSKELTERCNEDKGAISRTIEFLEKQGYIKCDSTAKKRYRDSLLLTEKGKEIGKIISEKINNILAELSKNMSEEDRNKLYANLELVYNNLANIKIAE